MFSEDSSLGLELHRKRQNSAYLVCNAHATIRCNYTSCESKI